MTAQAPGETLMASMGTADKQVGEATITVGNRRPETPGAAKAAALVAVPAAAVRGAVAPAAQGVVADQAVRSALVARCLTSTR
jgi:hypothetical protein